MLYSLKIASRYLTASKAQTSLLVLGVAVGVFIFIFMSALIGGLAEFILSRTAGDMSHVTIAAEEAAPALLLNPPGTVLLVQGTASQTTELRDALSFLPLIEALPEVKAVSPQITGRGSCGGGRRWRRFPSPGLRRGASRRSLIWMATWSKAMPGCGRGRSFWGGRWSMILA